MQQQVIYTPMFYDTYLFYLYQVTLNVCPRYLVPAFSINIYLSYKYYHWIKMENNNNWKWNKAHICRQNNSFISPRWGHSSCVINDQIIFFGGYADSTYMNDLWAFNLTHMTFSQIQTKGNIPQNRSNSSMNYDSKNNRIIVFGGGAKNKKRFNSISILDWNSKEWTQILPQQDQPAPDARTYHTAEFCFPYLIIFGGQSLLDLDDLWIFSFLTYSWKQIVVKKNSIKPCARRFHSSVIIKNEMIIIAGCFDKYRFLNDVWSIDLSDLFQNGNCSNLIWKQKKYEGNTFLIRWGHSSSVFNNKIYIFGGKFNNDLNDLLIMDLQNSTIKTIKNIEDAPTPRRRHCATLFGDSLIIFGGFNGQYYNDLHYINLKKDNKIIIPKSKILNKLKNLVSNQSYADLRFIDKKGESIFIHQEIFMNRFQNRYYAECFLMYLYELPNQQIKKLLKFVYTGFGEIDTQIYNKFKMKGRPSQKCEYKNYYNMIHSELKGRWIATNILSTQSELTNVIKLREKQWQSIFTDTDLIYTQEFKIKNRIIKASKTLLCLNSKYFQSLLSQSFSQDQIIQIQFISARIFMIIVKYLEFDILIVPQNIKHKQWIQLIQVARYYQLQRLVNICQYQLLILLNKPESKFQKDIYLEQFTIQKLFEFAIKENLCHVKEFCAQRQIKKLIQQKKWDIDYNIFSKKKEMNKAKDLYLKSIYLQLKQLKYRKNTDNHKKFYSKLQEQKENTEIYY